MEVILWANNFNGDLFCILHVCGGDPIRLWLVDLLTMYSPRMWRWSPDKYVIDGKLVVFSTYVEVILCMTNKLQSAWGILHVCGGDPMICLESRLFMMYSPRMWRWSFSNMDGEFWVNVFSTYVEVIQRLLSLKWLPQCILHVCGGDPDLPDDDGNMTTYSPRMWRWSLHHSKHH